jgi:hypothetical protein
MSEPCAIFVIGWSNLPLSVATTVANRLSHQEYLKISSLMCACVSIASITSLCCLLLWLQRGGGWRWRNAKQVASAVPFVCSTSFCGAILLRLTRLASDTVYCKDGGVHVILRTHYNECWSALLFNRSAGVVRHV